MEKKRVVPIWVSVVLTVLLVIEIVIRIYHMIVCSPYTIPEYILVGLDCLGCILALFYCFKGYQKNAAVYFKAFCISCYFSCLSSIFGIAASYQSESAVSVLIFTLHLIIFTCLSVIVFAKDLGKAKSRIFAGIILFCGIINLMTVIGATNTILIIGVIGNLILKIVLCIMVYAKYKDKEARGTK